MEKKGVKIFGLLLIVGLMLIGSFGVVKAEEGSAWNTGEGVPTYLNGITIEGTCSGGGNCASYLDELTCRDLNDCTWTWNEEVLTECKQKNPTQEIKCTKDIFLDEKGCNSHVACFWLFGGCAGVDIDCEVLRKEECDGSIVCSWGGESGEEPVVCGNGIVEGSEECDDNNLVNGDGCSSSCLIEEGNSGYFGYEVIPFTISDMIFTRSKPTFSYFIPKGYSVVGFEVYSSGKNSISLYENQVDTSEGKPLIFKAPSNTPTTLHSFSEVVGNGNNYITLEFKSVSKALKVFGGKIILKRNSFLDSNSFPGYFGYDEIAVLPSDFLKSVKGVLDHGAVVGQSKNKKNFWGTDTSEYATVYAQYLIPRGYKATGFILYSVNHDANDVMVYDGNIDNHFAHLLVKGGNNKWLSFSKSVVGNGKNYITLKITDDEKAAIIYGAKIKLEKDGSSLGNFNINFPGYFGYDEIAILPFDAGMASWDLANGGQYQQREDSKSKSVKHAMHYFIPKGYKATGFQINSKNHDSNDLSIYKNSILSSDSVVLVKEKDNNVLNVFSDVKGNEDEYLKLFLKDDDKPAEVYGGYIKIEKIETGGEAPTGESVVCGNGIVEGSEECDDGNLVNGDGCSSSCLIEEDGSCSGTPTVDCSVFQIHSYGYKNGCGQNPPFYCQVGEQGICAPLDCEVLIETQCGAVSGCGWGGEPVCAIDFLYLCLDETSCDGAGGYWYGDFCNVDEQVIICSALEEENCFDPCEWFTGGFWLDLLYIDVCKNIDETIGCEEGAGGCVSESYYVCENNEWIKKESGKCVGTDWWYCNKNNVLVNAGEVEGKCCVPDCTGKTCGNDGCGGVCGLCRTFLGESCVGGKCIIEDELREPVVGCTKEKQTKCIGTFYYVCENNVWVNKGEDEKCVSNIEDNESALPTTNVTITQTMCIGTIAKTCESFSEDNASCVDYRCAFQNPSCFGEPDACATFTNNIICELQQNCIWEESEDEPEEPLPPSPKDGGITAAVISESGTCTGIPASCSGFSINQETCTNQKGCEYNQSLCSGTLNVGFCEDYNTNETQCKLFGCSWQVITIPIGGTVGKGQDTPLCKPEGTNAEIISIAVQPGTRVSKEEIVSSQPGILPPRGTGAVIMEKVIYYCNPTTLLMTETIANEEDCVSDYECVENVCLSSKCTSVSRALQQQANFMKKIWCFLKSGLSQTNDRFNVCISSD